MGLEQSRELVAGSGAGSQGASSSSSSRRTRLSWSSSTNRPTIKETADQRTSSIVKVPSSTSTSTSPRPSIGSDTDVPYISYTIDRPIGESPKLQPKRVGNRNVLVRSKSPSPSRRSGSSSSFNLRNSSPKQISSTRRPQSTTSTGHDIVVVREFVQSEETPDGDVDLCRLQSVPAFLPIMRGALNVPTMRDPDVLDKLDYRPLNALCLRYERHLRLSADNVAAEQNSLATRIREIDFAINTLVGLMTERQKKYVKYAEKLGKVHEISTTLDKCQSSLKQTIDKMEALNALLPSDDRLEPFVWTTG